ncbi:NAD(P)H-binding protein [Aureibacter tunicatorum]|uniref:Uncharacterized protein YbjT (DUF2867 family) n=1 Tax=Aureibacter tunicatorum TaxID=866807 RepID=A0AAE3XJA5_9BACT|nr:NAD(P)H-binding protein [Aureibacter tunicatorum]MDR6237179.1 uncharacterized protein YbjT (DUF2867 family) [Aureibacter tunicatorum]BDD06171.1 oxidoreductase [Aureibacter tunicatorum]
MTYTAVVVGATGLVGKNLVQELINDSECNEIRVIVRRESNFDHPKVKVFVVDFSQLMDYAEAFQGDVLFSCLGTTRADAGSPEKQYLVDYTYQFQSAKLASENGVNAYVLVSSPFKDIDSKNYYRRMKAELEESTMQLSFDKIVFLRPNGLMGKRERKRFGENRAMKIFISLVKIFPKLGKYKPILGSDVAKAMLKSYHLSQNQASRILTYDRDEVEVFI